LGKGANPERFVFRACAKAMSEGNGDAASLNNTSPKKKDFFASFFIFEKRRSMLAPRAKIL
jgi:hypothetical protein